MMMITALLLATATMFPPVQQIATGAPTLQPNPKATQFTFVVAGDNRPAKSGEGLTQPLTDIVAALQKSPPAFVVWNGDSIYGKQTTGLQPQYVQFQGAFAKL